MNDGVERFYLFEELALYNTVLSTGINWYPIVAILVSSFYLFFILFDTYTI